MRRDFQRISERIFQYLLINYGADFGAIAQSLLILRFFPTILILSLTKRDSLLVFGQSYWKSKTKFFIAVI